MNLCSTASPLATVVLSKAWAGSEALRATQTEWPDSALEYSPHDPLDDPTGPPVGVGNMQILHKDDEPGLMCIGVDQGFKDV